MVAVLRSGASLRKNFERARLISGFIDVASERLAKYSTLSWRPFVKIRSENVRNVSRDTVIRILLRRFEAHSRVGRTGFGKKWGGSIVIGKGTRMWSWVSAITNGVYRRFMFFSGLKCAKNNGFCAVYQWKNCVFPKQIQHRELFPITWIAVSSFPCKIFTIIKWQVLFRIKMVFINSWWGDKKWISFVGLTSMSRWFWYFLLVTGNVPCIDSSPSYSGENLFFPPLFSFFFMFWHRLYGSKTLHYSDLFLCLVYNRRSSRIFFFVYTDSRWEVFSIRRVAVY